MSREHPCPTARRRASPTSSAAGTGTRLDRWLGSYAERTRGMRASEIRALFAVASRPEVVSLAGGMPYLDGLPLDVLGDARAALVADRGLQALQYGSGQGDATLREQICDVMALEGIDAHPDDVVVTVGSQQALDLVTRIFCDPGDVVLAEAPSYVGALGVFRAYQADVVHVPMDDDGLIPEALRVDAGDAWPRDGRRVKFLYTIPNFHNPAGVSISVRPPAADPRDLPRRYGVLVLEDNPYGLLGFDGEPLPGDARRSTTEGVIYLGSFSKTFAPGLPGRLGGRAARASARSSCWPASPRSCARRRSPRWRSPRTCRPATGRADQGYREHVPRAPRRA